MNTYGRFKYVEESIMMFLLQDYEGERELIIYNTDVEHPLILDVQPWPNSIIIINSNTDLQTGLPYDNVGAVRRDSLTHATGEYMIWWDDDDQFMPFNIRQCVDGLLRHEGKEAWKPIVSLFDYNNEPIKLARNSLEASVIVSLPTIRELGFTRSNGGEHGAWYQTLEWSGRMKSDDEYSIPGYCYSWSATEGAVVHRQSGDIGNPNNFENHKKFSTDHATRPLTYIMYKREDSCLTKCLDFFRDNIDGKTTTKGHMFEANFHPELIDKYVRQYL